VRLGLFFDGNPGASAQVFAQAPAGSDERDVKHEARNSEHEAVATNENNQQNVTEVYTMS
jgi:hypothetical protein